MSEEHSSGGSKESGEELDPRWLGKLVPAFEMPEELRPLGPWYEIPLGDDPGKQKPREVFPEATFFNKNDKLSDIEKLSYRLDAMRTPTGKWEKATTSNPRKVNLTKANEEAIDDWVRGGWQGLNTYARGLFKDKSTEDIQLVELATGTKNNKYLGGFDTRLKNVVETLKKLPNHEGGSYRRVDPTGGIACFARKIRPGDFVVDKGLSASSLFRGGEGAAASWGKGGQMYFDIQGKTGKALAPYSQIGGEAEVLFLPGTPFLVQAIKVDKDQTVWVLLAEVAPPLPSGAKVKNAFTGDDVAD